MLGGSRRPRQGAGCFDRYLVPLRSGVWSERFFSESTTRATTSAPATRTAGADAPRSGERSSGGSPADTSAFTTRTALSKSGSEVSRRALSGSGSASKTVDAPFRQSLLVRLRVIREVRDAVERDVAAVATDGAAPAIAVTQPDATRGQRGCGRATPRCPRAIPPRVERQLCPLRPLRARTRTPLRPFRAMRAALHPR